MKVIDVSGFGHSGKTAVTDLLREVDDLKVHNPSFEFGLLRLPDAIYDLFNALVENWSPIRSDIAIKRFLKLVAKVSAVYNEQLEINFERISRDYIDSLVEVRYEVIDWFDKFYFAPPLTFKDILKRSKILRKTNNLIKPLVKNIAFRVTSKDKVYLTNSSDFIEKTKDFLSSLLDASGQYQGIVTNNMFEPFNPEYGFRFFNNPYCIIVDRDPRDIYLSSINFQSLFVPEFERNNKNFSKKYLEELKRDFLGVSDIHVFISRQKNYREKIKNLSNDRIIKIQYEDLILNYRDTVDYIFKRVGIDPNQHRTELTYFDPKKSESNILLWKKHKATDEIKEIVSCLKEYCRDY